ncbi:hypothetical protein BST61_g3697 [Cercospora zeina]
MAELATPSVRAPVSSTSMSQEYDHWSRPVGGLSDSRSAMSFRNKDRAMNGREAVCSRPQTTPWFEQNILQTSIRATMKLARTWGMFHSGQCRNRRSGITSGQLS